MFTTALALIAASLSTPAATPAATAATGHGPIVATYHVSRGIYCLRSGWTSASANTARPVRAGECRTAGGWRRRGIAFDGNAATRAARATSALQVATR